MPAGKPAAPLAALTTEELGRIARRGLRAEPGSPSQMRGRRALSVLIDREPEPPKPRDPIAEADVCLAQALAALKRATRQ